MLRACPNSLRFPDRPLKTSKGVVTCAPQNFIAGPQGRAAPDGTDQTAIEVEVKTIASRRPITAPVLHVNNGQVTSEGSRRADQAQRLSRSTLPSSSKPTCAKGKAKTDCPSLGLSDDSMLFRFPVATASTAQLRSAHPSSSRSSRPDPRPVHTDLPSNLPPTCEARVRNHNYLISKEISADLLRLVDESLAHPKDLAGWSSLAAFADFNLESSPQACHDVLLSSSGKPAGQAEAPIMKRTRSANDEAARQHSKAKKKKKGKGLGDIKSPTSRTLLRMLRVGTGETTPNNTSKAEAEGHIRRLAGEYTPEVALAKRYAGREALQELMSKYIGRQITFQQAYECFDNPHNRGLQATPALHALLAGRKWPPYPENALCSVAPADAEKELKEEHEGKRELNTGPHELGSCTLRSHELMMALEQHPGVKLPESASHVRRYRIPFGQAVTTGAISTEHIAHSPRDCNQDEQETGFVAVTRPVITTGFSKLGTPFQAESEISGYTRQLGVRSAVLELRSFQLLTHNPHPPAAIVAIRRRPSVYQADSEQHVETPISLKSLRCTNMADVRPRIACLAPLIPTGGGKGSAATTESGGACAGSVQRLS